MELVVISPEDLKKLIMECVSELIVKNEKAEPEPVTYLYSLKELSEFLNCSVATSQKIKNSGTIRYHQCGRKLIFNSQHVLEDLKGHSPIVKRIRYKKSK